MGEQDNVLVYNELQNLKDYFSSVLAADADSSTRSLLFYVKSNLAKLKLEGTLSVEDVLHESFVRTQKNIKEGKTIRNLPGWVRKVCLNVMYEKIRENISNENINQEVQTLHIAGMIDGLTEQNSFMDIHTNEIGILISAWGRLRPCDQTILKLKHIQKWSWRRIAEHLSTPENGEVSVETARKRGQRSLGRLRILFFKLRTESPSG